MKRFLLIIAVFSSLSIHVNAQNVGIGTNTPLTKLTVQTAPGEYGITQTDGNITVGTYAGNSMGWYGTKSNHMLAFFTNNSNPQMVLSTIGNLGIGTIFPTAKLTLRTPDNTTGISHISEGGIIFSEGIGGISAAIGTETKHIFRLNAGGNPVINITPDGHVGIGTQTPGTYRLKVSHGGIGTGENGLDIENAATGDHWDFFTYIDIPNGKSYLKLDFNGSLKGAFVATTGIYSGISDERLKMNIHAMEPVLPKLMLLKPSAYQFRNSGDPVFYNGFIAQEVQKLFPSMVFKVFDAKQNLDVFTMDYSGFGVLAIKGIQELSPIVIAQKEQINTLEARIAKLEALVLLLQKQ